MYGFARITESHLPHLAHKLPCYGRHESSDQAVVNIQGRDIYLGRYGTPESKQRYNEIISQLIAKRVIELVRAAVIPPTDDLRIIEPMSHYK